MDVTYYYDELIMIEYLKGVLFGELVEETQRRGWMSFLKEDWFRNWTFRKSRITILSLNVSRYVAEHCPDWQELMCLNP